MKSPIYYAIFIDDISKITLLNAFKYLIPENWKQYGNHLTISFGKAKTETVQNYITNFIGHKVSFYIDSFGKSDKAIAVKTSADVKSSIEFETGGKFLEFWTTVIRWIEGDTTNNNMVESVKAIDDTKHTKYSKKAKPVLSDSKKVKNKPKLKTKIK